MNDTDFDEIMRIQRMMASRIVEERKMDHKVDVLSIVNDLLAGKKRITVEAVIIEAQASGIDADEVEKLLDELEADTLLKNKDGFVTKG